jgi:hypothetical protein
MAFFSKAVVDYRLGVQRSTMARFLKRIHRARHIAFGR